MEANEILEGNKLIAEFIGLVGLDPDSGLLNPSSCFNISHPVKNVTMLVGLNELKYHSSWDWLMPVVEKIESIYDEFHGYFGVYISSNSCTIQGTKLSLKTKHYVYMNEVVLNTKIESTFYSCIQFIKWYNKNNK